MMKRMGGVGQNRRELLIVLVLLFGFMANAQISQNVQLLGNYQGHRDLNINGTYYSGVWGYYDENGREYGILGALNGTAIVDLNFLPDSLHEVAFVPGPPASYSYREFKTYLHYLYIVSEGGEGAQIVDLSGLPNSVRFVGNFQFDGYTRTHSIGETDGYLYLNGGNATANGGTAIVSVRNPEQPQKLGTFSGHYVHDSYAYGDRFYAAGIFGQGLSVVNVSDKQNPFLMKTIEYFGAGTHNVWTTDDGKYALTTDEIGSTPKTLKIWDVHDLEVVTKVGEWNPRPDETIHNVFVKGNYAYTAFYKAGLLVGDISDPANPTTAGFYDTYPVVNSTRFDGAWGAYPYLPSGRILVSDMQTGLYVFQFDQQKIGKLVGTITDGATGQPITGAILRIKETGQTRWTGTAGQYLWGYATGTYSVTVEKEGYGTKQMEALIGQNSTTTVNIVLSKATSVENGPPTAFALHQNYPNPFNPSTTIPFELPRATHVTLTIHDLFGREVARLVEGEVSGGRHSVPWSPGSSPSNVYYYSLKTSERTMTKRMILVK
ncbi:MAG: choice-of-anchor B family protein [Ignavibacteriales bacterium]|nr:choice-of-anchor B family protein [Ignavibacteriales bacterium]